MDHVGRKSIICLQKYFKKIKINKGIKTYG